MSIFSVVAMRRTKVSILANKTNGGILYRETLDLVSPKVNNFIQSKIKSLKLSEDLEDLLLDLPKKRKNAHLMRPTLTYLTHKVFGGQEDLKEILPVLAVSELNNYYCYLDNWILDDKSGIGSDKDKVRQVTIASQILRDLTQGVIEESNVPDNKKREISRRLAETTMRCYEGQFQDLQMITESFSKYLSEEEYLDEYKRKSELQSGHLYGLSGEIGGILANVKSSERELLKNLFKTLGTGMHMSNDLGDFGLLVNEDGSFKPYQDQMADIKNGRMTYPIYYTLRPGSVEERLALENMIGNNRATGQESLAAARAILTSGAYDESKKILGEYYKKFKRLVHELPECPERNAISSTGRIIKENKYLNALKSAATS